MKAHPPPVSPPQRLRHAVSLRRAASRTGVPPSFYPPLPSARCTQRDRIFLSTGAPLSTASFPHPNRQRSIFRRRRARPVARYAAASRRASEGREGACPKKLPPSRPPLPGAADPQRHQRRRASAAQPLAAAPHRRRPPRAGAGRPERDVGLVLAGCRAGGGGGVLAAELSDLEPCRWWRALAAGPVLAAGNAARGAGPSTAIGPSAAIQHLAA
jgi:hypothetical protein